MQSNPPSEEHEESTMEINTLQLNTPKATLYVFGSLDWVTKKDGYCQSDELMTNQ